MFSGGVCKQLISHVDFIMCAKISYEWVKVNLMISREVTDGLAAQPRQRFVSLWFPFLFVLLIHNLSNGPIKQNNNTDAGCTSLL